MTLADSTTIPNCFQNHPRLLRSQNNMLAGMKFHHRGCFLLLHCTLQTYATTFVSSILLMVVTGCLNNFHRTQTQIKYTTIQYNTIQYNLKYKTYCLEFNIKSFDIAHRGFTSSFSFLGRMRTVSQVTE